MKDKRVVISDNILSEYPYNVPVLESKELVLKSKILEASNSVEKVFVIKSNVMIDFEQCIERRKNHNFRSILFNLIFKADNSNLFKLSLGFPEEVMIVFLYRRGLVEL